MQLRPCRRTWRRALLGLALSVAALDPVWGQRLDGLNVIVTPDHPFGSAPAERALIAARGLGARAVAIIPFLWQASPSSPDIKPGSDMSDDALRTAINNL